MTKHKQIKAEVRLAIRRKMEPQITSRFNNVMWDHLSAAIWKNLKTALFASIYGECA